MEKETGKREVKTGRSIGKASENCSAMNQADMIMLLKQEVVPALGCTEPVCAALGAAAAASLVDGDITAINLKMNPGLYKNGMAVSIPGFSRVGMKYAGALGAVLRNYKAGLQLLEGITPSISEAAIALVGKDIVHIEIVNEENLYAEAEVVTKSHRGRSIIRGNHSNIVFLSQDDKIVLDKRAAAGGNDLLHDKLYAMTVGEIYDLSQSADEKDLGFMLDGVKMNQAVSDYVAQHQVGIGIAKTLEKSMGGKIMGDNLASRIMYKVASCAEGRMTGCPFPVMSSAGSGNHGITVTMAIFETAMYFHSTDLELCRVLAFAHMLNVYIKMRTGKLSAMCGCGIAAATSVAAAIVYLQGGSKEQIGNAIINMAANITGMICDGGKVGCALKLATASNAAVMSSELAMNGVVIPASNGICAATPEETIANMGTVSKPGMTETDHVVLKIMLDKEKGNN